MLALLMGLAFAATPAPQSADAVVGRWKTPVHNGIVEISRCGASICGKIVTSDKLRANPNMADAQNSDKSLRGRRLMGLQILSGFKQQGAGWYGGKIYNAEDGKTYSAEVTMSGNDQLNLRGCVFKPFCRTQTWTRVR
ncbi:DUF2147 domain-containing protein [Sphingomonas sp. HITSZ_GF]|uniref:DUF2147 domain-containing protein n=1 Tax=Sphingomonas sp. HITSZ_GF TaxID=3037247 RepID=UPI00240DB3C4|nr:DUF2147 domain-containing protein [Sphingomonas sp. HITSZ_GF]MDG2534016.1 DUF2147 domain-containing protein [Sphingomonas sp. HITSZ_GF]